MLTHDGKNLGNKCYNLIKWSKILNIPKFIYLSREGTNYIPDGRFTPFRPEMELSYREIALKTFKAGMKGGYSKSAVRSSGSVSMPGVLDTLLNVTNEELLNAIYKVDKSWDSKHAKFYQETLLGGLDEKGSIIIQDMVDTTNGGSGVVTIYNGDIETMEWVKGSGEDLVGGVKNPESKGLPANIAMQLVSQISKIKDYCGKTEFEWGKEIEFAFDEKELFILQVRNWVKPPEFTENTSNKGSCAYPGKVTGQVFKRGEDFKKLSNPIFLSKHTMPEDTPDILNSKGIITEIGGKLSHASITAQTFKIPCLVGTGLDLNQYNYGDWVELDTVNKSIKFKTN